MSNGCIIDATPIAVDYWKATKAPQVHLHFLTHLHGDHTDGLTSTWRFPIYTSSVNALLLKKRLKLPSSVIRELEVGQSYLIPLDEASNNTMTVTVYDANHIPGAVMFLFQGYFGNILYCGDMRWNPDLLNDSLLRDVVQSRTLDILYLDNTYSAPYCQFPSREEATQQIFKIIQAYPDHEIKIGINSLGQEKLLEDIAKRCGERILVTKDRFEELQLLRRLDVFTTDPEQSRIHTEPRKQIPLAKHKKWNESYQTISIIPTSLFVGWKNGPYTSQASNGIHVVPYSDHSSYAELMDMVTQLAPHQIIPIVTYWSKSGWWADPEAPDQNVKADMTVYSHLLTPPPPNPVIIPEEVIDVMNSKVPRLLHAQPRLFHVRKGLSPRRQYTRQSFFGSSLMSQSLPSTPSGTPTSFRTSTRSDCHTPIRQTESLRSPRGDCTPSSVTRNPKCRPDTVSSEAKSSHVSTPLRTTQPVHAHTPTCTTESGSHASILTHTPTRTAGPGIDKRMMCDDSGTTRPVRNGNSTQDKETRMLSEDDPKTTTSAKKRNTTEDEDTSIPHKSQPKTTGTSAKKRRRRQHRIKSAKRTLNMDSEQNRPSDAGMKQTHFRDAETEPTQSRDRGTEPTHSEDIGTQQMYSRNIETEQTQSRDTETERMQSRDTGTEPMHCRDIGTKQTHSNEAVMKPTHSIDAGTKQTHSNKAVMEPTHSRDIGTQQMHSRNTGTERTLSNEAGMEPTHSRDIGTKETYSNEARIEQTHSNETETKSNKKTDSQHLISMSVASLLKETVSFIKRRVEKMNSNVEGNTEEEDELKSLASDSKLLLEALSCIDSVL